MELTEEQKSFLRGVLAELYPLGSNIAIDSVFLSGTPYGGLLRSVSDCIGEAVHLLMEALAE